MRSSPFTSLDMSFCLLRLQAYGTVYKAKVIRTGEVVALKKVKLQEQDEGVSSNTMR